MILSEATKKQIIDILDSEEFMSNLYDGLDEKKRIELGQVYTPAKICIQMIEKFSCDTLSNKTILDPTCGSGNLLIACLIAGADVDKLYGNEFDNDAVELCRKRLNRVCDILSKPHIKDFQIHQGNALHKFSLTYFAEDYDEMYFDGLKQEAARKRKLEDENYNPYLDSKRFRNRYPELHEKAESENYSKQKEELGGFSLWG